MSTTDNYALGRTERETRRLILQHEVYGPITRRFFEAAGIGAGMKVLDVGSGAGDVSLLVADLVGPRGQVVGVDMNPVILETARARTEAAGWKNVTFHAGDVREMAFEKDFDAVVGRWLLMYLPEPAQFVRSVASLVKPGGIIAFHENDFTYPPTSFPRTELIAKFQSWAIPPFGTPGPEMQMGSKLFRTYLDAGLPAPEFRLEAPVGGGPDWPGYELLAETVRSLMPMLTGVTGIDPDEVGVDTLAERLRAELTAERAIQMMPLMFGAWSRKP